MGKWDANPGQREPGGCPSARGLLQEETLKRLPSNRPHEERTSFPGLAVPQSLGTREFPEDAQNIGPP